jgi:hypothetical protein
MSKDLRGSLMIDDWEKQNGAFSMTFESISGGGVKLEQFRRTQKKQFEDKKLCVE